MATVTLSANTNYSALTVANGDTIELAGFTLNFDVVPAETGVIVQTPGTTGKLTFALTTTYPLTGWVMTAGTGPLIATVASGQTIGGKIIGGTAALARGVTTIAAGGAVNEVQGGTATSTEGVLTNNGTVASATGGSNGSSCHGVGTNASGGVVAAAYGGSASGAHGVSINASGATVAAAYGGSVTGTQGVGTNNGTVGASTGGSAASANGVGTNNGTAGDVTGGTNATAYGVAACNGMITGAITDSTGKAVNVWNGSTCFVDGPNCNAVIPNNIQTIYSLGALSGGATISGTATVIELTLAGGGGGGLLVGGGMTGGFHRT